MNHIRRAGGDDRGGFPVFFPNTTENTTVKSRADSHSPVYQFSESQRTVSISGHTEYQPITYFQQKAYHQVQNLGRTIGCRDCVPVIYPPFLEAMADDIARMNDQKAQRRYENGSFELAKAFLELMCILQSLGDAKKEKEKVKEKDKAKDLVELKDLIFKMVREDRLAYNTLSIICEIDRIYGFQSYKKIFRHIIPFGCELRSNQFNFAGISKEDCIELYVMYVKLCSFIELHNLMPELNSSKMVLADLYLARRATGHVFLPLHFKPSQFLRWLETCSTLFTIMPDCQDSSCLFECNDFSICSSMNHFFWTHGKAEYILESTEELPLEKLNDYYKHYLIEDTFSRLLFCSSEKVTQDTTRLSLTDELMVDIKDLPAVSKGFGDLNQQEADNLKLNAGQKRRHTSEEPTDYDSGASLKRMLHRNTFLMSTLRTDENRLNKSDVLFGEEFEFFPPTVREHQYYSLKEAYQLFCEVKEKFERLMKDKGIKNYQASICEKHHGDDISHITCVELNCSIGPWEMRFFQDGKAFEFNTTPYTVNQKFPVTVNGNTRLWTPYEMFDEFIHTPFRSMGAKGCSGHKHFDVMRSFNGNVGLLFRTIVDFENNSWLPIALGRLDSVHEFYYIAQKDTDVVERFQMMVNAFNTEFSSGGCERCSGDPKNMISLKRYMNHFKMHTKYSACALHHLQSAPEYTVDMQNRPTSTIEFRQFHCPHNGHESRLVNELLTARIDFLLQRQKEGKLIPYEPVQPEYWIGKEKEVVESFVNYLRECGLSPSRFKPLLRLEIPAECHSLFSVVPTRYPES